MAKSTSTTPNAATKAWATRKEAARKRSLAAVKANRTRKRNAALAAKAGQ
jgi:hypothetical protein